MTLNLVCVYGNTSRLDLVAGIKIDRDLLGKWFDINKLILNSKSNVIMFTASSRNTLINYNLVFHSTTHVELSKPLDVCSIHARNFNTFYENRQHCFGIKIVKYLK